MLTAHGYTPLTRKAHHRCRAKKKLAATVDFPRGPIDT